eukprot:m51a1_g11304 hypothetical protein (196) ;mRNA; f:77561-78453
MIRMPTSLYSPSSSAALVHGLSGAFVVERSVMFVAYLVVAAYAGASLWAARHESHALSIYHLSLLVGSILKTLFFAIFAVASAGMTVLLPQSLAFTLSNLPSILFFTAFASLYYLWLDRHALDERHTKKLARAFVWTNGAVYVVCSTLFVIDWAVNRKMADLLDSRDKGQMQEVICGFIIAVLYFPLSLGFLIIG